MTPVVTALEQAIQQLEEYQGYLENKTRLLAQLNQLLEFRKPRPVDKEKLADSAKTDGNEEKPADHAKEEEVVARLRSLLRDILLKEKQNSKNFCDQAFRIQLLLAKHWSVNNKDKNTGLLEDPITFEPITNLDDALPLASGHVILIKNLNQYYYQKQAYKIDEARGRLRYRHPIFSGKFLSHREISCFNDSQRVHFSPPAVPFWRNPFPNAGAAPDPIEPEAPAIIYTGFRQQFREQRDFTLANNAFTDFIKRRYAHVAGEQNTPTNNSFIDSMAYGGARLAAILLGLFTYLGFMFCVVALPPTLPSFALLATTGVALTTGIFAAAQAPPQQRMNRFVDGFTHGFLGSIFICCFGFIGQGLIAALKFAALKAGAVISSAVAATATSAWIIIQTCSPLIGLAIGLIKERFQPGALVSMFRKLNMIATNAPRALGAILLGESARLISRGAYALGRQLGMVRIPEAFDEENPLAEGQARQPVPNMQIHQDLGVVRAAPVARAANNGHSNRSNVRPAPVVMSQAAREEADLALALALSRPNSGPMM